MLNTYDFFQVLPTSRVPFQLSTNWNTVISLFSPPNPWIVGPLKGWHCRTSQAAELRHSGKKIIDRPDCQQKNFRRATVLKLGHNVIQNIWLLRWFGTPCNIWWKWWKDTTICNNQGIKIFKNCYIFIQITFIKFVQKSKMVQGSNPRPRDC